MRSSGLLNHKKGFANRNLGLQARWASTHEARRCSWTAQRGQSTCCRVRPNETAEEALARQLKESAQVEDRVVWLEDERELRRELDAADYGQLVILEIQGDNVCETGMDVEPELHWKYDQEAAARHNMEACVQIKHTFQRTARECTDVKFLEMRVPEGPEGDALKSRLGVELLPTLQFFRDSTLLWQQQGHVGMAQGMGEGVLYYGDTAGNGVKGSQYVTELSGRQQLHSFVHDQDPQTLVVLYVSTTLCEPCIKVFPAVLALARSFAGQAAFGRMMANEGGPAAADENMRLMEELNILEVPTFIFYRNGQEVGRHVGSSRGDLIGNILQQQANAGIKPPPPPPRAASSSQARARAGGRAAAARPKANPWR